MRLLKLCLLGAIAALGVLVGRRLLELEQESAAPPQTSTGGSRENGAGAGSGEATREELYREAKELDVEGRSKMNKRQLKDAVDAAKTGGSS